MVNHGLVGCQAFLLCLSFGSESSRAYYPELGRVRGSACDRDFGARHAGSCPDVPKSPGSGIQDTGWYGESVLAIGRSCRCHCFLVRLETSYPKYRLSAVSLDRWKMQTLERNYFSKATLFPGYGTVQCRSHYIFVSCRVRR